MIKLFSMLLISINSFAYAAPQNTKSSICRMQVFDEQSKLVNDTNNRIVPLGYTLSLPMERFGFVGECGVTLLTDVLVLECKQTWSNTSFATTSTISFGERHIFHNTLVYSVNSKIKMSVSGSCYIQSPPLKKTPKIYKL